MNVLFVSNEQFYPLTGGGSVGNLKIIDDLVERGHDVTVATPLYLGVEEVRRLEMEHNIRLAPFSPFYMHRNISLRGPKYLLYGFLFFFHMLRLILSERYDVVFVRNCLLAYPALALKPLAGSMYVLSMTDFLTGFLYEHGLYPGFIVEALFRIERFVPKFYDLVFTITPEMKRMLVEGGCQPSRIHVSYDGVDTQLFDPCNVSDEQVGSIRQEYGIEQRIVLFHGAILFTDQDAMSKLRQVISATLEKSSDISFLLIGHGRKYDEIRSELESERVFFPGYVDHDRLPAYIRASDVGIIPYKRTFNNNIIITLKLLEYLSMGLPVVSTKLKSIEDLFGGYDFVKISDSIDEFADDIISFAYGEKSEEAVRLIKDRYSWAHVTSYIVDMVEERHAKWSD